MPQTCIILFCQQGVPKIVNEYTVTVWCDCSTPLQTAQKIPPTGGRCWRTHFTPTPAAVQLRFWSWRCQSVVQTWSLQASLRWFRVDFETMTTEMRLHHLNGAVSIRCSCCCFCVHYWRSQGDSTAQAVIVMFTFPNWVGKLRLFSEEVRTIMVLFRGEVCVGGFFGVLGVGFTY